MSWKWAAFMPHPPIIVPEVGRGYEEGAAATAEGCRAVARDIFEAGSADVMLILSPHQLYLPRVLTLNTASTIRGGLDRFGAPQVSFSISLPEERYDTFMAWCTRINARVFPVTSPDLTADQGTMVPLYFIRRELGILPRILLASPIGLSPSEALELGRTIAAFDDDATWGLLASGDLSHRLDPNGANGYSPNGKIFDEAVVEALTTNDAGPLIGLSPSVRVDAGECGLRSAMMMLGLVGALDSSSDAIEVHSYEGPFGVGYCTAFWGGR